MAGAVSKNFSSPDETRPFKANGQLEVVNIGDSTVAKGTFGPGWKWSNDVKPIAGTDLCQAAHLIYMVSGKMVVQMADGSESEMAPGDVVSIEPGHDAWVVGDEPCVSIEMQAVGYAKQS